MRNFKNWAWLFLFGSLWGINEVIFGKILFKDSMLFATVWLAAWAFFMLAIARGVLNKPGSSTVIGIFAVIFKLANTAPFFCHLLGIFALGLVFDVFSTFLMKNERKVSYRSSLSGVLSAYGGFTLFALVITYFVRYEYWIAGGLAKVIHHIFVNGSFAALIAIVAVPLGYWIGVSGGALAERRPRWTYAGALVGVVILWTLGRIIG